MRTAYGFQVDAWGSLIMEKAALASELEQDFSRRIVQRGIEGLVLTKENVKIDVGEKEEREHIVLTQDLGEGDLAKFILRFSKRGNNDLEISWRLFEQNPTKDQQQGCVQSPMFLLGLAMTIVGVLTIPIGGGCIITPLGVALLGASMGWWKSWMKNTSATTYHQFDSRALAQTVDFVLMKVLAEKGFSTSDLRIIKKASIEGLGQLSKANLVDDLTK